MLGIIDELNEESEEIYFLEQKKQITDKILKVQSFLKNNTISKWHIVVVEFGDHLLKDSNLKYRNIKDSFTVETMKNLKGLNYGEYEFCYEHMALILSDIHHKYINNLKSIVVVPISSTKRKNSILIEKRFNNFLLNDSYILLDNIKHISLERINTKKTERILNNRYKPISPVLIEDVKNSLKKSFDIS